MCVNEQRAASPGTTIITISVDFLPSLVLSVFPPAVKHPCLEVLISSPPLRTAGLSLVRRWEILRWAQALGNVLQRRNKAILSRWRGGGGERQNKQGLRMEGDRDILINQVKAGY